MNKTIELLRDMRLYAVEKGASEAVTKLEISEGKVEFLVFLNPLIRVLIMSVEDSDWEDIEGMRAYIRSEIDSNVAELIS